ncbi:hypothetical protein K474DRAFT_350062 [Panus rudis PR-1116 ss-1]|nr:hypothetical protein K474DRAFT_350062 [Panus rudis PR-1116 ss-1]
MKRCGGTECLQPTANMGFRQAAVLASSCFCLGVLSICFSVDYRVLFAPLTDAAVRDGLEFYTTFFNSPPAIKVRAHERTDHKTRSEYVCFQIQALLHGVMGMGLLGLVGKIHKWDESAMFFDGSSLAAFVFAIAVYLSVSVPASKTIALPIEGVDTREDQIEALRILSAGNVIMIVLLVGILVLQVCGFRPPVHSPRGDGWGTGIHSPIRIMSLMMTLCFFFRYVTQAGEEYVRRLEAKELAAHAAQQEKTETKDASATAEADSSESKKDR